MATRARVLITGGSGFLGACLTRRLIAEGYEVHLALRASSRLWRLVGLEGRYLAHEADLCDAAAIRRAVQASRPEIIFHLATHGAYPFQRDRATILATNLQGTANLLDALDGHEYRALVQTGSSSEYGQKNSPMCENDILEPRSDYGVTKAAATLLCQAEAYKGRPVTSVRVFSAYGPWEEPTRLVPYVMDCCFRGENPKVTAGVQPRDFIFADDVLDLLVCAAECPAAYGQILHAGTGIQSTVRDMIETIVAECGGGRVRPEYGAASVKMNEPTCWIASIACTQALTGWRPRHDLRAGIRRMWQWYTSAALPQAA